MDIPLPGEPDPQLAKHSAEPVSVEISSPHNIPLPSPRTVQLLPRPKVEEIKNVCSSPPPLPPSSVDGEDSNRYSPSRVTGDDDAGKDDQHDQESTQHHGSPLVPTSLGSKGTRTTVLGKVQAKKRLLAFSMTKQGGGQGLSFGFNRKAPKKMSTGTMPFAGTANDDDSAVKDKDERLTSPKKKGMGKKGISRDDKARAVVSAIEEIKREEMLMRGVLGYNSQLGPQILGDQTFPLPLMSASVLPPVKPRDDLEMCNILSEQRKGAIEELLGSLLTHDSEKKSKEEEKERKRSEEKRKRDSEKSSHHSKEHHRSSKERHSRSGREREKEEKKHRPSELPKNWQQFRDRGFKFEEIRRLKLKLEKDKRSSNNRGRTRKSRDREHRSRSREKRHKSPSQTEDKDRTPESDHDIMCKPFESTPRLIYPFMAVGIRQMQKEYPRSLIHFTKFRPSIPYCENPASSKAYYRTREEILCEASQRVVDLMHCVINGDLCKINSKTEKNYKAKQTTDANLSNSLAALQVSYDETEIDENMSSSDDTSGTRRERPWFLPEKLVVWPDGEEACPSTGSDVELNVKRERSDETDVDNYRKKKDSSVESSEVRENELPNYLNSEREGDIKSSEPETKGSLRSGERTTVRSKWDSDYEDDRVQDDITVQNSHTQSPETVNADAEKWEEKDRGNNFAEISTKDEMPVENQEKSGSESDNSSDSSSESSSANESNSEDSTTVAKDSHVPKDKETENKQNLKNGREIDEEIASKSVKSVYASGLPQECSTNNAHPENSGDGNTNLKLASEYEEFMKAVSFESSAVEDGDMEIPSPELAGKSVLKRVETPDTPAQERRSRRNSADSEASHDKLDIEPARIEETEHLKKLSETKLHNKPKLMTSSASEDELMPPEKEEKQESKVRALESVEQNNTHPKKDRKQRSSSSDSSSSSESSVESEEVKEKRKSKSKKASKKKRKKVVHNKKKQRKTSKKKRANSSSSSESDSSSNADSSSSSSDDNRKKHKHKESRRKRAKSSSSEGSDSSSENVSSDDRSARKKKKKKKAKRIPKKKPSKKRKRSRKESESSDSEDNVRSRRSKSTRHKSSKKDISKENNIEQYSSDEKAAVYEESNSTSHRKDSDVRSDHNKKTSGKSKGGSNETETSHRKSSKKYSKDSSIDENYIEEREKKSSSKKKSSSHKKSSHYRASDSSEDESEKKNIKKRRRERRSCTTSPVVSSNKKRRRSPSTSPEHSPTPQRRNSTEGKTVSQRERSKEQSSRKLKHSSGSKKGHKQKDLEVTEQADDFSEECSFKRNEDMKFRNSSVLERNDWEDNSSNEDSCDNPNSREEDKSDDAENTICQTSPRKTVFENDYPVQLLRSEDIKKEVFSEEDEDNFMGKDSFEGNVDKNTGKLTQRFVSDDETEDNHGYQKHSHSSISGKSDSSRLNSLDKYSFVQVKVEPEEVSSETEKDLQNPEVPLLYSPDPPEDETPKSHLSHSQSREVCSTDSSQFSHIPDKIVDRYGSDLSQESFKDTHDANFSGKLFRKQNYNVSEESFRPGSKNPETPRVVSGRGTNFTLDNIPLPPILASRDDTTCATQLEDICISTRNKQINKSLSEKLSNLPVPEINSSAKSVKTANLRQAIAFKLLSPSGRLQSSQSLVGSSDNVDDDNSNMSEKHQVTQVKSENSKPDKKIESDSEKRSGTSVFESSRDEWLTNRRTVDQTPTSSIVTETTNSEVTSSSKIPIGTESGSSISDSLPKERQRKRPSRWGMTTVPPKKKVIEELYDSLPLTRNETDVLSQSVNEKIFYDQYISSDKERKENISAKEVQGIGFVDSAVKKSSELLNEISQKKELTNRSESRNLSEWEMPEGVEEGWEAPREKDASHKNRYIHEQWQDRPARREKFTAEKVGKDNSEGCGPLIDWENDLEQPKGINVLPTEAVNLFHYSHEPEISKTSSQALTHLEKENICQDESGSEWESREVTYHSKSSAFRTCDVKLDAKEKIVRERHESVEKSSQRHLDFTDDDKSWEEKKWQKQDVNASKQDERRHSRDEQDMRDKRSFDEGNGDVYKDVRGVDDSDAVASNKEEERTEESQATHDYQFREKYTEDRREKSDPNKLLPQTQSLIKYGEDRKVSVLISGEHTKDDKSEDQYRKDEKEKVSKERRDVEDQDAEDVHDKNKKEYAERIQKEIEEREQRDEDRIRKSCGEREKEKREVDDDQRREDRNRKDYCVGERIALRDKERRENDIRDSRHDEESVRKDFTERDRSSARDRERRDSRDRREERRRERERERRSDRRDRGRWEREKRERHREDRESNQRNRSPTDYHHDRGRRESHREDREHSHSPPPDYWQGEWEREPKERDCDCTGNYYLRDIPLPVNSTLGGASSWPSGAVGEADMELSCSPASSPLVGFKRSLADSTISDSELVSSKQEDLAHRSQEMSPSSTAYPPGIAASKSYEKKPSYLKQQMIASSPSDCPRTPTDSPAFSPKRLSLDDRIEMELGVKNTPPPSASLQYQVYQHQQPPPCPKPQQAPLQHQVPSKQPPQQQQSTFPYSQYYAHVPPPTQFESRSDKFLSMPPPPYGQPVEEYSSTQHMYPPPSLKPGLLQMPPPSLDAPPQKRRPPLLPTPNIRPLTNWDSPEAFIGVQPPTQSSMGVQPPTQSSMGVQPPTQSSISMQPPIQSSIGMQPSSQSSRVVQVGNVLQVVPVEVPPPAGPGPQSTQSMVLQAGNVLQVIPSDALPNTVPPVSCSEPPPVTNSSTQVVQVGNVLQVIPGTGDTSTRPVTMPITTPPKSTFPPTSTHLASQGLSPHIPPLHLPPMHAPPPGPASALLPSPTHPPPPHGIAPHPPPTRCPPPHTPPMRGPPIHTPPIQVPSVHGLLGHAPSPSPGVPLLTSPSLEMSPSPAITSPLVSAHGPVPPPVSGVQVSTSVATSPIPSIPASGATVISSASSPASVMPPNVVPTPVAAPISYSPPASPFLVPPVVHASMVPVGLTEGAPAVASQDCPIPFLSSVEMAQASRMEEAERRRAERARRRAEKEKRRKEKEKRHQNKIKQATEMIIKKALEQEGEMLSTASDIDLEEMRLIEEAMQQVPEPEEEEEMAQTDAEQQQRKRKRKNPVDVQILPAAGKGILVSPGFREKPLGGGGIERKSVKFADGVRPGEGTSPSAGEDLPSPPPPPRKLPKEKRYKKKKKKKIKVKIIRQINVEDEDDDDEDISPPPPPPGSPPPPPMYPPGTHYPPTYPSGFTYSTAPPFTVLPGVDSSAATGTSGNLFTPLYHQHHHTTTTTHTTTVQFAPPPPPVTPVPPPPPNPHMFKRESKSNP